MKVAVLGRADGQDDMKLVALCAEHKKIVAERWRMLGFAVIDEGEREGECAMCPPKSVNA